MNVGPDGRNLLRSRELMYGLVVGPFDKGLSHSGKRFREA